MPEPIERSTFVLVSAIILWLLYWQWRPIADEVWRTDNAIGSTLLYAIYFMGWASCSSARFSLVTPTFWVSDNYSPLAGQRGQGTRISDAASLQVRAPPALLRIASRFLGDACHDDGPPTICGCDNGLHTDWDFA